MAHNKFDIYVYAHWKGMAEPKLIGTLSAHFAKVKRHSVLNTIKYG